MRNTSRAAVILSLILGALFAITWAQEDNRASAEAKAKREKQLKIVPLVALAPGESKELLLTTWCTVGITRGGGFGVMEMRNGKPFGGSMDTKRYERDGVTVVAPSFQEATKYAAAAKFEPLQEHSLDAFVIQVSASEDASPGLMEMHLVDATCAGWCKADFRVLVTKSQ